MRWILPKESATGSNVYTCTFLREIISDGFFYVPEDFHHDFLYRLMCTEHLFTWESVHGVEIVFLAQASSDKDKFSQFVNIFGLKQASRYVSQKLGALWFSDIFNSLKTNIFVV